MEICLNWTEFVVIPWDVFLSKRAS